MAALSVPLAGVRLWPLCRFTPKKRSMITSSPRGGGTACARTVSLALVLALLSSLPGHAATRNWTGTPANNALWTQASLWGGAVPTSLDDAFFNSANTTVRIDNTVSAACAQLSLGRHALNTSLAMSGGTLAPRSEVFIGQYSDGSGWFDLSGGTVNAATHFTVGASGTGDLTMSGGVLNIGGTFFINRYTGTGIDGYADLSGGTINAGNLSIGSAGKLVVDNTTLTLVGDKRTLVNNYLAGKSIVETWKGFIASSVTYDAGTNRTTLNAPNGRYSGIASFGPSQIGQRAITYDYSGVRKVKPSPASGVHPRIFFDATDLPDIRDRLENTAFGREVFKMVRAHTLLLREGTTGYNTWPASDRVMPNGSPRFANVGIFNHGAVYAQLIAGDASGLTALDPTHRSALLGQFALEAFECLVQDGQSGIAARQANLAQAMDTWADWAVGSSDFGSHSLALAYDMVYGSMTPTQRGKFRKVLALQLKSSLPSSPQPLPPYSGVTVEPEALVSNWVPLNTFQLLVGTAIEGEAVVADAGFSAADLFAFLNEGMTSLHNVYTYGWYSNGAPYEGQGKNSAFATHLVAFARRGYDFFGHPHLKAYGRNWISAVLEPYGYASTKYDVLGGNGLVMSGPDLIGLKWMYPDDPGVDFAFRNGTQTLWTDANGNKQTFIDTRLFSARSNFSNELLAAAIFAQDVSSTASWTTQNAAALGSLDYLDTQGGTLITRSGFDPDAARLMVHIRQDFGGHTAADRNSFNFGALGRTFVDIHPYQNSNYHSVVRVDDVAMKVTAKDGQKMRIPSKLAAWKTASKASFVTGDATYAYSWEWFWRNNGGLNQPRNGVPWEFDLNSFNTFRRTGNKISEAYGNQAFKDFPQWWYGGLEGIQRIPLMKMRQVYRTIGLVRSGKPYVLVVDDVRRDDLPHNYKWCATLPNDLALTVPVPAPANFNAATDVILKESAGDRCLLVRVLLANGTPQQFAGTSGSSLAYLETIPATTAGPACNRLVIERASVVEPQFRVLLFAFRSGEALPTSAWSGTDNNTLTVGTTVTDTFTFVPRMATVAGETVTISEFNLTAGATAYSYTNLVEPTPVR